MTSGIARLADGRSLQFWEGGDPAGTAVFFLPGCPDCRRIAVTGDVHASARDVRLIAVNRPGYGASTPAASDHTSVADDVAALADELGIADYRTVGMSLGGPYALACAARHPQRVRAVSCVASPAMATALDPPFHRDGLTEEQQSFFRTIARATADEAIELARPEFAAWVASIAPQDPDDDALARRWLDAMSDADRRVLARLPNAELAASARETLASPEGYLHDVATTFRPWTFDIADVRCPVQLWYGAEDTNLSQRDGAWLSTALAQATLQVLPATTHLQSLVDNWDRVLDALLTA